MLHCFKKKKNANHHLSLSQVKISGHRSPNKHNIGKSLKYYENYKMDTETEWANAVRKMVQTDLLNTGLPETFNLLKNNNNK